MIWSLLFASAMAFAQPNCDADLTSPRTLLLERLAKRSVGQIDKMITELDRPEWPGLIPGPLYFEKDDVQTRLPAAFAPKRFLIYIDDHIFLPSVHNSDTLPFRSALIHELGHVVFYKNMGRYDSSWKVFYKTLGKKQGFLSRWFAGPWPGRPLNHDLSDPYQELFADLLTIMATQNPRALYETVKFLGARAVAHHRAFDRPLLRCTFNEPHIHEMLAPARAYLWENYFSKIGTNPEAARYIAKTFHVIATEVVERYNTPSLIYLTPEQINLRLLHRLREHLGEPL